MIIERWQDGVLISSEELPDTDPVDETVTISKSAVEQLASDMNDPSINSIAEVKAAIMAFVEDIK